METIGLGLEENILIDHSSQDQSIILHRTLGQRASRDVDRDIIQTTITSPRPQRIGTIISRQTTIQYLDALQGTEMYLVVSMKMKEMLQHGQMSRHKNRIRFIDS
jgi:hypothetical protein